MVNVRRGVLGREVSFVVEATMILLSIVSPGRSLSGPGFVEEAILGTKIVGVGSEGDAGTGSNERTTSWGQNPQ